MSTSTIITFAADSSNHDVKIAGNFTDWQQQSLVFNDESNRFEYKVDRLIDGATNGKYSFKFVVDGNWQIDQEYSSEFDASGNENNVVLYDYTSDKSASSDHVTKIKDQVSHENKLEPLTPEPTPYNLSKQTTNAPQASDTDLDNTTKLDGSGSSSATTAATASATAAAIGSAIAASAVKDDGAKDKTSKDESKSIASSVGNVAPKGNAKPVNDSADFIALTEPTKAKPVPTESSSIPGPEPVERPEVPTKTQESNQYLSNDVTEPRDEPPLPQPVKRPEPPVPTEAPNPTPQKSENVNTTTASKYLPKTSEPSTVAGTTKTNGSEPVTRAQYSNGGESANTSHPSTAFHSNENTRPSTQLTQNTEPHPPSQGKGFPEYSIGFFATILQVITQFFRRWFS